MEWTTKKEVSNEYLIAKIDTQEVEIKDMTLKISEQDKEIAKLTEDIVELKDVLLECITHVRYIEKSYLERGENPWNM